MKLDVKEWVAKVTNSSLFVTQWHTLATSVSLNAGGYSEANYTVTKAGYYPVGVVGYQIYWVAGSTHRQSVYQVYLVSASEGSATVRFAYSNYGTAAATSNLNVTILWRKV